MSHLSPEDVTQELEIPEPPKNQGSGWPEESLGASQKRQVKWGFPITVVVLAAMFILMFN